MLYILFNNLIVFFRSNTADSIFIWDCVQSMVTNSGIPNQDKEICMLILYKYQLLMKKYNELCILDQKRNADHDEAQSRKLALLLMSIYWLLTNIFNKDVEIHQYINNIIKLVINIISHRYVKMEINSDFDIESILEQIATQKALLVLMLFRLNLLPTSIMYYLMHQSVLGKYSCFLHVFGQYIYNNRPIGFWKTIFKTLFTFCIQFGYTFIISLKIKVMFFLILLVLSYKTLKFIRKKYRSNP